MMTEAEPDARESQATATGGRLQATVGALYARVQAHFLRKLPPDILLDRICKVCDGRPASVFSVILRRLPGYTLPQEINIQLYRSVIAKMYLQGEGIEIGALNQPLSVPPCARVRYLDRLTVSGQRAHYPEFKDQPLPEIDILDDGQALASVADGSQDFVIANSVLEHLESPLTAVENAFRVLKPGGLYFFTVPDKQTCFDLNRPVTPFEHLLQDYRDGGAASRRGHYEEWVRIVKGITADDHAEKEVEKLMAENYSIHYHCWTYAEAMELVHRMRSALELDFGLKLAYRGGDAGFREIVFVLQKAPVD